MRQLINRCGPIIGRVATKFSKCAIKEWCVENARAAIAEDRRMQLLLYVSLPEKNFNAAN